MVLRMRLWLDALTGGGISNDALPVIVLLLVSHLARDLFPGLERVPLEQPLDRPRPGRPGAPHEHQLPSRAIEPVVRRIRDRRHTPDRARPLRRQDPGMAAHRHVLPGLAAFLLDEPDAVGDARPRRRGLAHPARRNGRPVPVDVADRDQPRRRSLHGLSRVFSAVQGKKGLPLDRYASFLPYRGYFEAVEGPDHDRQDVPAGPASRRRVRRLHLAAAGRPANETRSRFETDSADLPAILDEAAAQSRQPLVIEVTVQQPLPVFVAPGEPLLVDREADVETAADASNVTSLRPAKRLNQGDTYTAVGLVSTASVEALRASGDGYPSWVTEPLPPVARRAAARRREPGAASSRRIARRRTTRPR